MLTQTELIPRLWTAARAMFARMRAALADAIAARQTLSLDHKHAVRTWLAPLETMARKTVLIHALALIERGDTHAPTTDRKPTAAAAMRVCHPAAPRPPSLRLWPRTPAGVGSSRRDHAHLALAHRMRALSAMRGSGPERLARRIDALARLLEHPLPAARRLARTLCAKPHLALKLALVPSPRTQLYPEPEYAQAGARAFADAYDWSTRHAPDTS